MKFLSSSKLHLFVSLALLASTACSSTESSTSGGSSSSSGSSGSRSGDNASGTGNSPEGEALFEASGAATPDEIFGVWANPSFKDGPFTFHSRLRLSADAVESAARCTREDTNESLIASVQVSARISDAELAILEAKSDERVQGDFRCEVNMAPRTTKACTEDEMESDCFVLDGTTLTIYGSTPLEKVTMTKVSD